MQPSSFRSFLLGEPRWQPGSVWPWYLALLTVALILIGSQVIGFGLSHLAARAGYRPAALPPPAGGANLEVGMLDALLVAQVATVLLTFWAATLRRRHPGAELRLIEPDGGARTYLHALLAMLPVLVVVNMLVWSLRYDDALRDFRAFTGIARSPDPLVPALAIGLGAPLSEELLFRGLLLAPLAGRLGFWPAAVLVSLAWTALHWNYTLASLATVFAIGLYLAWTLWRTGSLWVAILCHAIYNCVLLAVLRYTPLGGG